MTTQKAIHDKIGFIAHQLVKLVEVLRKGDRAKDSRWWNGIGYASAFEEEHGYEEGATLFRQVVDNLIGLNGKMLSLSYVQNQVFFHFCKPQVARDCQPGHLSGPDLETKAREFIDELASFYLERNVDIPIAGLQLQNEDMNLGHVYFRSMDQKELDSWYRVDAGCESYSQIHYRAYVPILAKATVTAPGEDHKAAEFAKVSVRDALDAIRALCAPFSGNSPWALAILGEGPLFTQTSVRIGNMTPTYTHPVLHVRLQRIVSAVSTLDSCCWELMDQLLMKRGQGLTEIEAKIMGAIKWLSESTKPDRTVAKYLKQAVALELLLGGESKDENLTTRGLTATLSERGAFIASEIPKERRQIDRQIRTCYGKRSDIVHGRAIELSDNDLDAFGGLIRRIAVSLLKRLVTVDCKVRTVDDLAEWTSEQRYGNTTNDQDRVVTPPTT